jgi:hypothetical protein
MSLCICSPLKDRRSRVAQSWILHHLSAAICDADCLEKRINSCCRLAIAGLLSASVGYAQFGTASVKDQDIGRPPSPPFITLLGIVSLGQVATDPTLPPRGPVAELLYEELRGHDTPAGHAGEVVTSIEIKYDEAGRVIEQTSGQWGFITKTINKYQGRRLVTEESTFPDSKKPRPKFWNYWTYDQAGKLIEYRRGSGDELQNQDTNFKRDAQGRLTSFEYRQGAKDELSSRTELRYSADGKTVDSALYGAAGDEIRTNTQTTDEQGHVMFAVIRERDWRTKKPKTPIKVAFKYDSRGRLVEQNTDAYEFERSGSENELPPGRVSIVYDDLKRTKTTTYTGDEGTLASKLTFDSDGATIAVTGGTKNEFVHMHVDCEYDIHGNWTTCREMSKFEGVDVVAKTWRRTIKYR